MLFVQNLQSALERNDNDVLKTLIGTPWYSAYYRGAPTEYKDVTNALAAFRAQRQGALITVDPERAPSQRVNAPKLGERTLVARWVSRSGAETLAYVYVGNVNGQWRWTGLLTGLPNEPAAALPTEAPAASGDVSLGNGHLVFTKNNAIVVRDLTTNRENVIVDTENGTRSQWDWTRDGARALFVQGSGADRSIWSVNADGSGLQQLTSGKFNDAAPHWSADGSQILFARNQVTDRSQRYTLQGEVWLMNSDGSEQRKLADGFDAVWSPDGQRIAFATNALYIQGDRSEWTSYARNSIHLINSGGRNEWMPLSTEMSSAKFTSMEWQLNSTRLLDQPHWSPDGRELAVRAHGSHGAYVATDPASGGLSRFIALYFDSIAHGFSYSPDGTLIALASGGLSGWETLSLYRRSALGHDGVGGSGIRTLGKIPKQASDVGQKIVTYQWSPDSTRIAYLASTYPNNDLGQPPSSTAVWIMDLATGASKQLTVGDGPIFWLP